MATVALAAFIITGAMLYFMVRYRVHIHVTYTRPAPERRAGRRRSTPAPIAVPPSHLADLTSALVNLGTEKKAARAAAGRAIEMSPAGTNFNDLLRKAIQEAA